MKFHGPPFHNDVAQTAAILAAAPPGFKVLTPGRDCHFWQRNYNGNDSDITVQIPKR
jgi:hypothetical protein